MSTIKRFFLIAPIFLASFLFPVLSTFADTLPVFIKNISTSNAPTDVVKDASGNIYVLEKDANIIEKFDSNGDLDMQWGGSSYVWPGILTIDSSDNIYIFDSDNIQILKFNSSGAYVTVFGSTFNGGDSFSSPSSIVADSLGNVYVGDSADSWGRIIKFDSAGNYSSQFPTVFNDDHLTYPSALAVDASDNIYVADGSRIVKFDSSGNYISEFGSSFTGSNGPGDSFSSVTGLAVASSTGGVYVVDGGSNRIVKFDSLGVYVSEFGQDFNEGDYLYPSAVAVATSGDVYVLDNNLGRLVQFDSAGTYIAEFSGNTSAMYSLAVDSFGSVLVAEPDSKLIQKIDTNAPSAEFSNYIEHISLPGKFDTPQGIAIDSSSSYIYVADTNNARIQKFDTVGNLISVFPFSGVPNSIALDASGNMYVTDSNVGFQKLNSSGVSLSTWGGEYSQWFVGITLDTSGNIYVADGSGPISKYSSTGTWIESIGGGFGYICGKLSVDTVGNIYVPRCYGTETAGEIFDSSGTNIPIATWPYGSADGQLQSPGGIFVDALKNIFISDTGNNRIAIFSYDIPEVSVSSPADNTTFNVPHDPITLSANATATVSAIESVTFYADDQQIGDPVVAAPYDISWDVSASTLGSHVIYAVVKNASGIFATSSVTVNLADIVAPTVSLTSPSGGSSFSLPHDAIELTADASDEGGIDNVKFYLDTTLVGSPATTSPYAVALRFPALTSGAHTLSAVAEDASGNTATSTISITTSLSPAITILSPVGGSRINLPQDTVTVSATTSDTLQDVRFYADGAMIGSTTLPPYSTAWDTSTLLEGTHTIDVVFRDTSGVPATSSVTVYAASSSVGFIRQIGINPFTSTNHVVFDPAGNVYVVDGANYQIEKFDSAGNFVTRFGANGTGDGEFSGITAIAIDRWSNIYVLDVNYYTSARVQKFDSSGNYLAQWGSIGTDDGQFMNPRGIAVDLIGNVFISDTDNHRIESFDSSGNFLSKFGTQGSGNSELNTPTSLSFDASGNIYVNDLGNAVIKKFSSSGVYVSQWAKPLNIDNPYSAARDSMGNIYVVSGSFANRVVSKISSSGKFLSQIGMAAVGDGDTRYVSHLAVDSNDNLYMIVQDNAVNGSEDYHIQKFDSSGNYLAQWGSYGFTDGQLAHPTGLAIDSLGNVYEAESQHFYQKFDASGNFVAKYGTQGNGDGQFQNPSALYIDTSDNVFVVDGGARRVQKFNSSGTFLAKFGSSAILGIYPKSITGDSLGNIYVGDSDNAKVVKFDSSGTFVSQWGSSGGQDGQFGKSGGNGGIFSLFTATSSISAVDYYNNRIQRFDLSGNFLDKIGTSQSSDNGQLNSANDIFVDASGNVYVADTNNNRVQKFNSSGDYVKKWDLSYAPSGVSVDYFGNLYVTSSGVYVQKINDAGTVLRQWGGVTFNGPTHVAYDLSGNSYVVDSQNYRIVKFDIQGNVLAQWGAYGSGNGEFQSIHGIAVDPAGYVYIVDAGRIQKFNLSGTYLAEWTFDGNPEAITVDASGDVYVTDTTNGGYKKFDAQGNFISAAGQANVDLSTPGLFNNPSSVAVTASGIMYVLDAGNSRIQKFGSDRKYISSWGSEGSGQGEFSFNSGSSVVVDSSGNIYVSDTQNNRIQKFDSLGDFVAEWGSSVPSDSNGAFESPRSAALDSLGNIYVADTGNNRIQKFDSSGAYVSQFGSSGSGDGQFNTPLSVAIDSLGNIYVVDSDNARIQKFDSSGNYILQWGGTYGSDNGQFKNPQGIKIDANDNVYVVDYNNNRIQKFDSSGNYLAQWGRSAASYNPVLQTPSGVTIDTSGNIFVASQAGNKIIKYASTTEFVFAFGSSGSGDGEFNNPDSVALDSAGNIYVSDTDNHRIQKFDSGGNYLTQFGGLGTTHGKFNQSRSIAIDASDNVYVFDGGNQRIQKFDSTGAFISQIGKNEARVSNPNLGAIDSLGNVYVVSFGDKRVVKFDSSGNVLLSWGGAGSGDGQFNNPQGIVVNASDEVYVLDAGTNGGNSRVEKFDSNGTFVSTFVLPSTNYYGITTDSSGNIYAGNNDSLQVEKYDSTGNQVLTFSTNGSYVSGIIVDITGSIYISDSALSLIKKFDSAGTEVGSWGSDQLSSPAGLAINNGNLLVINANNFVATYDFSGSSTASLWGSGGSGDGQFSSPVGIAVNPVSHDVYVIDRYNNRIQKFDSGGNYLTQFGNPSSLGEISNGGSLAVGSSGDVYLNTNSAIIKYDSFGNYVASSTGLGTNIKRIGIDYSGNIYLTEGRVGTGAFIQKFDSDLNKITEFLIGNGIDKAGIAIDSDGNMYVTDQYYYNNTVSKFDPSGNLISSFGQYTPEPNDLKFPMDLAVDASGNSYVADTGNNRIQKFDSSGTYVSQFGTVGSADGEFNSPAGLAVDSSDNIYVADTGNNRIQKFDSSGGFITKWDLSYSPNAVSVDTSGNLYVTSSNNAQVYKIDVGNNLLFKIGAPQSFDDGQLSGPAGLAVDSSDNIYVADTGNNRIQKFDSSGTYVSQFGTVGSADGEFSEPLSVAVGNGNIYVADTNNARVQKFDSSGNYLSQFDASDGVQFSAPYNIVLDTTGNVYVSDDNYNVQKFDSTGAFISLVSDQGSEDGQVSNPRGLAFASSTLYVADAGNNRVQLFNSDDTFLANIGKLYPAATPFGIGVDSSGNVYVSDESVLNIKKYALDGTFLYAFGTSGSGDGEFANTHGLSIDSLGNIYVADTGNHRIQKFDSSGTYVSQFGTNGTEDGQFQSPEEVSTDPFGRIFVADTGNNRVSLFQFETLDDNSVPTVLITSPVGGTSINLPHDPITVSADASDNVGVESVSFYVNGTLLGTAVTSAPYSISWNVGSSTAGSYLIDAVAKDFSGLTATSTISITVIAATSTATSTPPTTPPSSSGGGRSGGGGGGKTVIAASSTPMTGPAAVEALRVELKKALIDAIRQLILLLQEELLKKLAASISG